MTDDHLTHVARADLLDDLRREEIGRMSPEEWAALDKLSDTERELAKLPLVRRSA